MRYLLPATLLCVGIACVPGLASADVNIALNKPVTLNGLFGEIGTGAENPANWPTNTTRPLAAASTLDDGVFQPEETEWQVGSVWWNPRAQGSANNSVVIDLGGTFALTRFSVQADDNDTYLLEYLDSGGTWHSAWDIPAVFTFGLVTRDTTLASSVVGTALRFTATGGDEYYAVSEIQAFGQQVPEPASYALVALGLGLAGVIARRRERSA